MRRTVHVTKRQKNNHKKQTHAPPADSGRQNKIDLRTACLVVVACVAVAVPHELLRTRRERIAGGEIVIVKEHVVFHGEVVVINAGSTGVDAGEATLVLAATGEQLRADAGALAAVTTVVIWRGIDV